jgi:uncharacterized membrane protein YphA (DoxX/SURF4 family)/uncharacterized membrane protein
MINLSSFGRICYGIAIAGMGIQTIWVHSFPYILPVPENAPKPVELILAYMFGTLLTLTGACFVVEKKTRQVGLLLGAVLLLIFFFYYIPYEIIANPNYKHFAEWENAEKELALAGGALVIAGCFSGKDDIGLSRFAAKLIPAGAILYAITVVSFGILHFLYGKEVAFLVPSWIPYPVFWIYFAGAALIGSGLAIILRIRVALFSSLLGIMIFLWFVILHIPRVVVASANDRPGEIISAFLALAYSGIAFLIAGIAKKGRSTAPIATR